MTAAFETSVLVHPAAISGLTDQILKFLQSAGVDARSGHHVALALEEILTNLATHGNCAGQPVKVRLAVEPDKVRTEIVDPCTFFDLRQAPEPDLNAEIEDRAVGGLGLFLIRQFASDIDCVRRDGMNFTTFSVVRAKVSS